MRNWQKDTLPEICMEVHMHHTGSCDDLTHEEHASAVAYDDFNATVRGIVARLVAA